MTGYYWTANAVYVFMMKDTYYSDYRIDTIGWGHLDDGHSVRSHSTT